MTLNLWTTSFEIGHPLLDQQHKELLGMLDDLDGNLHGSDERTGGTGGAEGEKSLAACKKFRRLVRKHSADEEDILQQADFPELGRHKEDHNRLIKQIEGIFEGCGEICMHGNVDTCLEELTHLMLDHIIRHDLSFKSHLQTKKLAPDRR